MVGVVLACAFAVPAFYLLYLVAGSAGVALDSLWRDRTLELLLTAPVRPWQVVVGKYLAALAVMGLSVLLVGAYPAMLAFLGEGARGGGAIEWGTLGTGLLGLFLLRHGERRPS